MLNWAARYYPILRILNEHNLLSSGSVLEIGSGPYGLGTFRKVPFTGCDLSFPTPPKWPMTPVIASATDLPFDDNAFDAVLASDVLEHIPPGSRMTAIREALRVTRDLAIFCFPSGAIAQDADRALRDFYLRKRIDVPSWLEEHMLASFPDESLFDSLRFDSLSGWNTTKVGNESIHFHSWMMRQETRWPFVYASMQLLRLAPRLMEKLLRLADRAPYYRQIFVLSRCN